MMGSYICSREKIISYYGELAYSLDRKEDNYDLV